MLYSADEFLDGIDLLLFKVGLAALPANPCRNGIECDMPTPTVSMKRSMASFHFPLAMDAFHFATLNLKSSDHSPASGIYAVIMAR